MPHTTINVENDCEKYKVFAELQAGDWFFVDGTYYIVTDKGTAINISNGKLTTGIEGKCKIRPIKKISLKIEWI